MNMKHDYNILIYGYGNPGRQDDGLGDALIGRLENWPDLNGYEQVTVDVNYQLQVEDAILLQDKDLVIFVDASMAEEVEDIAIEPVEVDHRASFTMHAISPGYLLAMCRKMYGNHPPAYILHIRGYEWGINEPITDAARENLDKAWNLLKEIIREPEKLDANHAYMTAKKVTG